MLNRDFRALFAVQFLGAFNDNLVKNAVAILIGYRLVSDAEAGFWLSVAAGLFILPFMLISPWAGRLADQFDKLRLIQLIKLAEVFLAILAAWALISQSLFWLLVAITALGIQSAFFGPIKYAIIPERVASTEWMSANAWFSGSTFIAILLGTLLGGWGAISESHLWVLATGVFLVALLGAWASFQVTPVCVPKPKLGKGSLAYGASFMAVWQNWHDGRGRLVIAISLFWFIGATLLSQLPHWVQSLGGNEQVAIVWLAGFAVSFGLGAALRTLLNTWLNWHHQAWWLGLMALVLGDAAWLSQQVWAEASVLVAPGLFFSDPTAVRISLDLALIAILGGLYTVPLYTQLQRQVAASARARAFALNNVMNALWMVLSALALMAGYSLGLSWPQLAGLLVMGIGMMAVWVAWRFKQTTWLVAAQAAKEKA
ncbi:MFS transporter [Thiomicrospira cyclica]|uniref:Major facilitator superfamily MFS_1 n=1 Tax=Thiomicrospira cyclica (strain DSM 14477 / JCM 11371 / ALM1) TaxID=717773 RepID=F6DBJ1_THICA|nr:MFS transporter [Thiomicrospira cyclica]AEG32393.1 major facilitator superfamily MFS_1 [Thiomicrospira cyclica ALM1]